MISTAIFPLEGDQYFLFQSRTLRLAYPYFPPFRDAHLVRVSKGTPTMNSESPPQIQGTLFSRLMNVNLDWAIPAFAGYLTQCMLSKSVTRNYIV